MDRDRQGNTRYLRRNPGAFMSNTGKIRSVLFLSPESPYPLHGGGQYRTASLIHYFAGFANVDLILFSESGKPALLPKGLVRSQTVIPLPPHGKGTFERYARNARRALLGVPPLIDRLGGLGPAIEEAIGAKHYDVGIVEHFWLAPYVRTMRQACTQTVLDLHNVESMLHQSCAEIDQGLVAAGHRRFARSSRKLETKYLPQFSAVLATSDADRAIAQQIAPDARISVYPNSLPAVAAPPPDTDEPGTVVFSGNFEYHPNIDAVEFLVKEIWPLIRSQRPDLRLRLVGRGDKFIRHLIPPGSAVELSGEVGKAMPEIARGRVIVAPLRMGSGTRIKILEAWAANRPVVATPLAAQGLRIEDGKNIVLAGSAHSFADQVLRLVSNAPERDRLAARGRLTFEENYTWDAAWVTLDRCLQVTRSEEVSRYTG
jgi:polysaccharide biosynthesis protein PslH